MSFQKLYERCKKLYIILILKTIIKYFTIKITNIKNIYTKNKEYLTNYTEEKVFSKLKYEDLAPKDNIEESDGYFECLEWAIENENICNIALTGPYGSGKSSILKAFEKKHVRYKYLNISLSTFYDKYALEDKKNTNDKEDKKNINDEKQKTNAANSINEEGSNCFIDISEIEKGILQQLFYRVDSKHIPYTRFKKINNLKSREIIKNIIFILFFIIIGVVIFAPNISNYLRNFIPEPDNIKNNIGKSIMYVIFIYLMINLSVKLIKYFKSKITLKSLNFKQVQLEVDKQSTDSVFNQFLDEILYFFEATEYNVVVIEDLDRFNNTKIFIKLRELNQLINNYEKINRKIVFVYAVKDDIFKNNERTKFFDFIIPVIPIINQTNSSEKLKRKLEEDKNISKEFLKGISVYIQDMRILTNICNEYKIYKSVLNKVDLKSEKLLALIVYKNLYPNDFAEIQYDRGLIYKVFEDKNTVIEKKVNETKEKIKVIENKIECADSDHLANIKELKVAFLSYICKEDIKIQSINNCSMYEFLKDEFDIQGKILNRNEISYLYYKNGSGGNRNNILLDDIDKISGSKYTFKERFERIKYKNKAEKDKLNKEIQELKDKIKKLKSSRLEWIIKEFGAKEVLDEKILKENPLVYLLRHGKIDETYVNYLTYFHEGSLTVKDKDFILSIRNYEPKNFDYNLTKITNIIEDLNYYEFEQKEALNVQLLEFILKNEQKYENELKSLMKQLSDESEISKEFIDEFKIYIDGKEGEVRFWQIICSIWKNLWIFINNNSNYTKEKIDGYLYKIIKYASADDIKSLNIEDNLVSYIENSKEFLPLVSDIDITNMKSILQELKPEFSVIDVDNIKDELLNYIWDECFYKINIKTITDILSKKYNSDLNSIKCKNLTTIRNSNYENLIDYINDNMEKYINNVLLQIEEDIYEDIKIIIELLNLDEDILNQETKTKIVNKEEFILENITDIPNIYWEEIIKLYKIEINWSNILEYYQYIGGLNSTIIEYLNNEKVYIELPTIDNESDEDNEVYDKFIQEVIDCNEISYNAFNKLIDTNNFIYSEYDIPNVCEEHMNILINNNKLEFNSTHYNDIKSNFDDMHIKFIEHNFDSYIENIDDYEVDAKSLYEILKLSKCDLESKKAILSHINNEILDDNLVDEIYDIIISNPGKIKINIDLYWKLFEDIDYDKKIQLLLDQIKFLEEENITKSIENIGEPWSNILVSGSRSKIPYSERNLELAISLDESEYISSHSKGNYKHGKEYIQINSKFK
ncbi:hypothetical protein J0L31_11405 [Terrisporobacter glycolicus]|nr:hypothetical protein [Terrisporobacter glycolicus]